MACGATLKRTMDFDPLLNPTAPKRRRCIPVSPSSPSSSSAPRKYLRMEPSPFGNSSSTLSAGNTSADSRIGLHWLAALDVRAPNQHVAPDDRDPEIKHCCCSVIAVLPPPDHRLYFCLTRTNIQQHQTGVQTHSEEEASRWKLPSVRGLLFSRVPIPVVQHYRLVGLHTAGGSGFSSTRCDNSAVFVFFGLPS